MRVVPHDTCIRFGKMAAFVLIDGNTIPTFYYNFTTYESLAARMYNPKNRGPNAEIKPLTDYIGLIKHISGELPRKNKRLRKVTILDTSQNELEITFWEDKRNVVTEQDGIGSILAVSSTIVTYYPDKETTAKAIFYDEAMTDILEMPCEDMIMSKGYNDTTIIPDEILAVEGQHCQVQMTLRRDTILNVNRAKKLSLLTPATPITKAATPKRTLDDSPGSEHVNKKFKM